MQKKSHSLLEALTNYAIGYAVAIALQVVLYPFYGIRLEIAAQAEIAGWFTVVSIVRSYCVRRFFNHAHIRGWL